MIAESRSFEAVLSDRSAGRAAGRARCSTRSSTSPARTVPDRRPVARRARPRQHRSRARHTSTNFAFKAASCGAPSRCRGTTAAPSGCTGEIADGHARFGSRSATASRNGATERRTARDRIAAAWELLEASLSPSPPTPPRDPRGEHHDHDQRTGGGQPRRDENRNQTGRTTLGLTANGPMGRSTPGDDRASRRRRLRGHARSAATTTSAISTVTQARELDDREGRIGAMGEAIYARVEPPRTGPPTGRASIVGLSHCRDGARKPAQRRDQHHRALRRDRDRARDVRHAGCTRHGISRWSSATPWAASCASATPPRPRRCGRSHGA